MWNFIILILILFAAIPLGIAGYLFYLHCGNAMLQRWLEENGYELIESENRLFKRGPFSPLGKQIVFKLTVRSPETGVRSGWLGCGGQFSGLLSERAEMIWDQKQGRSQGPEN